MNSVSLKNIQIKHKLYDGEFKRIILNLQSDVINFH